MQRWDKRSEGLGNNYLRQSVMVAWIKVGGQKGVVSVKRRDGELVL